MQPLLFAALAADVAIPAVGTSLRYRRDLNAARSRVQQRKIQRAFRVSTGVTPRSFVEERRIERAKQRLARSDQPLVAIAMECGFASQSRLTTAFKRRTGFTPAQFRRGAAPRSFGPRPASGPLRK